MKGNLNDFDFYNQLWRILTTNSSFTNTIFIFTLFVIFYKSSGRIYSTNNNFQELLENINIINNRIITQPFYQNFLETLKKVIKLKEENQELYENPLTFVQSRIVNSFYSCLNQPLILTFIYFFNRIIWKIYYVNRIRNFNQTYLSERIRSAIMRSNFMRPANIQLMFSTYNGIYKQWIKIALKYLR
jgi:hypothetical protein